MFHENLHAIYKEIFYLCKVGFSAEYIESITPLERKLNWQYHEEDREKNKNKGTNENGEQVYDALSPDLPVDTMPGQTM